MSACIYCIKNNANNHCYIGQTINYVNRKSKHFRDLKNNEHCNTHLQRAYNKYGAENFSIEIIEDNIPLNLLKEREDYWIDKIGYYNIDSGRKAFTPTALRNMSESHLGNISPKRKLSEEEVFYILAIDTFCDGAVRAIAGLSNGRFKRQVPLSITKRETYCDVSKKYDNFPFEVKIEYFKKGLEFYNYDFWKNTNSVCPKKNRYCAYILEKTLNLKRQEVADIVHLTKGGLRNLAQELREQKREINTTFTDEEIKQILRIVIDEQYRAKLDL